jgi:short-subunit dehydrogenase
MANPGTTLIVGASPDLVEMAKLLGRDGGRIGLLSRNAATLQQFKDRLTARDVHAQYFVGDVTETGSVQSAFARVAEWSPQLDCMIYNVGIVSHETASAITSRGLHKVMSPNFFGFVNCFQLALPLFRRNGRGHAITLSSAHALDEVQPVAYAASKASLRIYITALRRELAGQNLEISEVYLGQKQEANGWRDLVCEEIIDGMLRVVAERPERFLIGGSTESSIEP